MDDRFHYYSILMLARKAGFSCREAKTIAYASQYADDATEHKPFAVTGVPEGLVEERLWRDGLFDPVCTAHGGASWHRKLWKWAKYYLKPRVQHAVLLPFHFIPSEPLRDGEEFSFVTDTDSPLARFVVMAAVESVRLADDEVGRELALIRLGLALHTWADTWAHAGFSGRHCSVENDIEAVEKRLAGSPTWEKPCLAGALASYGAPDVGHSEAGSLPDSGHLAWRARYARPENRREGLQRDNGTWFLLAARTIYGQLVELPRDGDAELWTELSTRLLRFLIGEDSWERAFPELATHDMRYNPLEWRLGALAGDSVEWDDFDDADDFAGLSFRWTGRDLRWFLFHQAALEQRRLVHAHIPPNVC